MPRNRETVKVANIHRAKSKAKLIEWEPRVRSRGTRDVPVEVSSMESQPKKRKRAARQLRAENTDGFRGETAPRPMDVDEAFWPEEPVAPTSEKKVRQPVYPSSTNLTYFPAPAYLFRGFYPQD
jgi:hypothetical protein